MTLNKIITNILIHLQIISFYFFFCSIISVLQIRIKKITTGNDVSRSCSLATSQSSSLPLNLAMSFIFLQQNFVSKERKRKIKSQMNLQLIFTVLVRQ